MIYGRCWVVTLFYGQDWDIKLLILFFLDLFCLLCCTKLNWSWVVWWFLQFFLFLCLRNFLRNISFNIFLLFCFFSRIIIVIYDFNFSWVNGISYHLFFLIRLIFLFSWRLGQRINLLWFFLLLSQNLLYWISSERHDIHGHIFCVLNIDFTRLRFREVRLVIQFILLTGFNIFNFWIGQD